MRKPYSIKIFLPGGDPDGLRIIEKSNWSGVGLVVPRSLFNEGKQRKEMSRTGVYVLVGPPEESGLPRIYIGEGDPVRPRLEQHAVNKDFWTSCIIFTSKDENLNKAHVQYLESKLVAMASAAKRCVLENGNVPQLPSLSESDAADAQGFLAEMMLCFPLLNLGVFTTPASAAPGHVPLVHPPTKTAGSEVLPPVSVGMGQLGVPKPRPTLFIRAKNAEATGSEVPQGFVVQAGSRATGIQQPSCGESIGELRSALVQNGVLMASGNSYSFTQDYLFSSPSAAAGVILGRSSNGRTEWKTADGTTLKQIQEAEARS